MSNSAPIANVKLILMEQGITLWRHKWIALAACWVVCLAGWAGVMMMPRKYESNARAFVDVNGLLTPLLKGLVIDTTGSQTTDYLRQTLLSRPNLEQAIHLAQLDIRKTQAEKEALVSALTTQVAVRAQGKNLFTISYTNSQPEVAQSIVQSLLTIFAEKAASSNRVEMEKARKFLDDQITSYEQNLRAAEQRRADFRRKYEETLADPISGVPRLQALAGQMSQAQLAYNQAVVTSNTLAAQLAKVPQYLSPAEVASATGTATSTNAARLAQAKASLEALQLQYTDKHPDVVSMRRQIADLEAMVNNPASAVAAAPAVQTQAAAGQTRVPNPTYEQIRLKLVDAETLIPAAKQRLDQATVDYQKTKALATEVPDMDAKAKDLDRDYEIVKKNHEELLSRREAANLSQAADDQADRTQFRIVDPPQIPTIPSFPNLPIMFSVVLLIGIAAGVGLPIVIELVRATFSSAGRLRTLGLPVIGAVTYARRPGATRGFIAGAMGAVATSGALLVVYGALMVLGSGAYRGVL